MSVETGSTATKGVAFCLPRSYYCFLAEDLPPSNDGSTIRDGAGEPVLAFLLDLVESCVWSTGILLAPPFNLLLLLD
jgi:hypothetical protein